MTDKSLYQIALTQIKGVGVTLARNLMEVMGDEEAVFKESISKLETIPRISKRLITEIRNSEVLRKAEKELEFVTKNNIHRIVSRLIFVVSQPDEYRCSDFSRRI